MKQEPIKFLLKRIGILVLLYQITRFLFYVYNFSSFNTSTFPEIIYAFIWGFRFDMSAIFIINFPIIFLFIISYLIGYNKIINKLTSVLYYTLNIPFLLFNCIDLEYFKFQGKRTTADFFQLFTMGEDMKNTIPKMAADFWYVIVIFLIITILFIIIDKKIKKVNYNGESKILVKKIILSIFIIGFSIIISRGGLQLKPINIMSAAKLTSPQLVPLVLNTPFTVIRTIGKTQIEEQNYFSNKVAETYFNKIHNYKKYEGFNPLNVVIIILESFSSEYIGAFNNGNGYTPFLDSLIQESITFNNAFANAKKSIDGIPAVVASMPSLMPASYISTPYSSNKLKSIAAILATKGYSSAFFHGGNNGTMNFDNFTMMTGYQTYYGRNEYSGNKNDYDGHWGIYDEYFYNFFIEKCNNSSQPFINTFFSLSSHHPYSIPEHLKGSFPSGELPIHESIGYADYALSLFFNHAKNTTWYNNTLFVITADHTGPASTPQYNTKLGMFRIPIIFYQPNSTHTEITERVTQQTDILPGILDYLNYDEPFVSFGNSMFDTTNIEFAITYPGDIFQITGKNQLVQFDGSNIINVYNYKKDHYLMNTIVKKQTDETQELVNILKSFIQQYNSALVNNTLTP